MDPESSLLEIEIKHLLGIKSICLNVINSLVQHLKAQSMYGVLLLIFRSLYLSGLSEGTSVKASSGLGSGMGMMYSLKEVTTS